MRKWKFPGSFFLHPVFIVSMSAVLINNLWFKPSRIFPLLAGKITDVAVMIYLPALLCLGVVFVQHAMHSIKASITKDKPTFEDATSYVPSDASIITAIVISGSLMIFIKGSDAGVRFYAIVINYLNDVLLSGRVVAAPVKDTTDLVSLAFLIIPYFILKRTKENQVRVASSA